MTSSASAGDHTTGRLAHIDALRGVAVLSVLVYHMLAAVGQRAGAPSAGLLRLPMGYFGVLLFFMISGYVISVSVARSSLGTFWRRRLLRLYPAYWLSIAGVLLVTALGLAQPLTAQFAERPIWVTLANLTMIQRLLGVDHLMGVYWSLFVELIFYGLVTLLIWVGLWRHSIATAVAWCLLAVGVDNFGAQLGLGAQFQLYFFALMWTGVVLYHCAEGRVGARQAELIVLLCMLTGLLIRGPAGEMLARAAVPLLVLATLRARLAPRWLVWLGEISYSLYLLHLLVIAVVTTGALWLDLTLWFGGSIGLAWATYHLVERPCMRLGRRPQRLAVAAPGPRAEAGYNERGPHAN